MNTAKDFNEHMAQIKQAQNPVVVKFIKKECTSVLVEYNGEIHRVKTNRMWYSGSIEDSPIVEARLEDLKGDYLKK